MALLQELEARDGFREFTCVRRAFEEFLLNHRILVNQVTVKYGSGPKGFSRLKELFLFVLDGLGAGRSAEQIVDEMKSHVEFSFLQPAEATVGEHRKDFGTDAKSAVFLRDALKDPLRCGICGGLMHRNAISIDHIIRRQDGGLGEPDNGQLTHPYCNTTVKN